MNAKHEIFRLLEEHRAEVIRKSKREIYRLRNGQLFVTGTQRGAERCWRNRLALLKRMLGIVLSAKRPAPKKRKAVAKKLQASEDAPSFVSLQSHSGMRSLASELKRLFPDHHSQRAKE
jgi:hypothetical protein